MEMNRSDSMETPDRVTFSLANAMLATVPLAVMIGITKTAFEAPSPLTVVGWVVAIILGLPMFVGALLGGRQGMSDGAVMGLMGIAIGIGVILVAFVLP